MCLIMFSGLPSQKVYRVYKFDVFSSTFNIANELSHDSGAVLTKKDVVSFYYNAIDVIDEISKLISR